MSTWYVDAWLGDAWCDSMFNCSEWSFDNGDCSSRSDQTVAEAKVYSKDHPMFITKTEAVSYTHLTLPTIYSV